VRPKTSGNADAGLEDGAGKLPSDRPDCGMTREGMMIVDLPENGRIREARGRFRSLFWLAAKSRRRVTLRCYLDMRAVLGSICSVNGGV
jgi:hypothetical protein